MELQKIGAFLAALRKERGLTQEQLGERIGVTNKTISRWEKGNYLPPAEMLKELSELYGVSINEILCGACLDAQEYRDRAEENITAAISGTFGRRERLNAAGQWLRSRWWMALLCLTPAAVLFGAMPLAVSGGGRLVRFGGSVLVTGVMLLLSRLVFHVSRKKHQVTKQERAYGMARMIRRIFLIVLGVMLFVSMDLLLAAIHSLTPAGNADGYAIHSVFYDILIQDGGIYPDNCFRALEWSGWQTFLAAVINLDQTILWMKK